MNGPLCVTNFSSIWRRRTQGAILTIVAYTENLKEFPNWQVIKYFRLLFAGTNITHSLNVATPRFPFPTDIRIRLTSAYAVIFLIALLGNTFGLFVVLKKSSQSHRVTNLFIANMAVADLLLTVTLMSFQVASFYSFLNWIGGTLGNITCKAFFTSSQFSIQYSIL